MAHFQNELPFTWLGGFSNLRISDSGTRKRGCFAWHKVNRGRRRKSQSKPKITWIATLHMPSVALAHKTKYSFTPTNAIQERTEFVEFGGGRLYKFKALHSPPQSKGNVSFDKKKTFWKTNHLPKSGTFWRIKLLKFDEWIPTSSHI